MTRWPNGWGWPPMPRERQGKAEGGATRRQQGKFSEVPTAHGASRQVYYQAGPETAEFRGWRVHCRGGESLTSQALTPEMTTDSVIYTFLFYVQISKVSCQPRMTSGWRLSTRSLPLAGRLRNTPPSSS